MSDEKNKIENIENEEIQDNVTQDINDAFSSDEEPGEQLSLPICPDGEEAENDSDADEKEDAIPYSAAIDNLFGESDILENANETTEDERDDIDADNESLEETAEENITDGELDEQNTSEEQTATAEYDESVGDLTEFDDVVKPQAKPRKVDSLFDFIEIFVFTLAAVFIITSFFLRYSIVEGHSMQNTLQDEDKLLITNFMYEPEYGDIVVLDSNVLNKVIVKRVIALEGQTVKITPTEIYVDGKLLDEPYVYIGDNFGNEIKDYYYLPEGGYFEITVPEGEIFVMGDHRNNSDDSRSIGTISKEAIIGKVILRFAPFSEFGKVE